MKINEMKKICHDVKGKCDNCPLCRKDNWLDKMETWCFIDLKQSYIKNYKQYKEENNEQMAELVMKRYKEIEKDMLGELSK